MKLPFVSHQRLLSTALAAVVGLGALVGTASAQSSRYDNGRRGVPPPPPTVRQSQPPARVKRSADYDRDHRHDHDHDDRRRVYLSRPRSSFTLTLGTGYAGRGYYYAPSGFDYFYEGPSVRFFRTQDEAYRAYPVYRPRGAGSVSASVQRALARRGYYSGPIDGALGAGSRRAIVRWQNDHGLRPTGEVTPGLLRSLGL